MKISFKKNTVYFALALAGVATLFVASLVMMFLKNANVTTNQTFDLVFPIAIAILLVIGHFGKFEKGLPSTIMNLIGLGLSVLVYLVQLVMACTGSIDIFSGVGNNLDLAMAVIIRVGASLAALSLVLVIVSFIVFSFSHSHKDMMTLLRVGLLLLVIFSSLVGICTGLAFFAVQNTEAYYIVRLAGSIIGLVIYAVLIYFLAGGVYAVEEAAKPVANIEPKTAPVAQEPVPAPSSPEEKNDVSTLDEEKKIELIKSYKELLDQGILTKEEFEKKKEEILK